MPNEAFTYGVSSSANYHAKHKDFDTFRFELQLPKTNKYKHENESGNHHQNNNRTQSIQFCVRFISGIEGSSDCNEYWDSNHGANYEIIQYFIEIEQLKSRDGRHSSLNQLHAKQNTFRFDDSIYSSQSSVMDSGIYY
jgi:hypothetical protein